jgi:hypothetical protein
MNDLQAKFAITLVALGALFSYALPAMKQMQHNHETVVQHVSQQPYVQSAQAASTAPDSGSDYVQR